MTWFIPSLLAARRFGILLLLLAAAAALLAACGGSDDDAPPAAHSPPRLSPYGFYTGERFLADARLAANPDNGVLITLRNPALLAGSGLPVHDTAGINVVPYDFLQSGPYTYCWDGSALQAAAGGAPHRLVLRDESLREVLTVEEGGPCVTQAIAAGRYTAILHFGTGRSGARDLVFLMPQREPATVRTPQAAAPGTAASGPVLACPQVPYVSNSLTAGQVAVVVGGTAPSTLTGACGDLKLVNQSVPVPPGNFIVLGIAGPQTKVTLYSLTNFRGTRWQVTASGQIYDYAGQGDPQVQSMVPNVGTLSTNRATLISTNACPGCDLRAANLANQDLHGAVLHDADLSHADLANAILTGANAARALFASAHLVGAKLNGADLSNAIFRSDGLVPNGGGASYPAADLSGADLSNSKLDNASMTGVSAASASFAHTTIAGVDFSGADLTHTTFESASAAADVPPVFNQASMTYASLKNASLPGAFFRGAQLAPANLGGARLAGAWMQSDGSQGPTVLVGSYMYNTDLSSAHLSNAVLDGVSWFNTSPGVGTASGVNAQLAGASFIFADLPNLDLSGALLQGATLANAQLINANMTNLHAGGSVGCSTSANLGTANLRGATLIGADLSCANLANAAISTAQQDEIYIEVLADPGTYQNPAQYQYFPVNRPPTALGGDASGPAVITDSATCPDAKPGPCGTATNPKWSPLVGPQEPTNCQPTQYDADGNVTAVTCTSNRHPTGS